MAAWWAIPLRGTQYTCNRYAERLEKIGSDRPVGSKGDSFENAAAASLNSPCEKELIDFAEAERVPLV